MTVYCHYFYLWGVYASWKLVESDQGLGRNITILSANPDFDETWLQPMKL